MTFETEDEILSHLVFKVKGQSSEVGVELLRAYGDRRALEGEAMGTAAVMEERGRAEKAEAALRQIGNLHRNPRAEEAEAALREEREKVARLEATTLDQRDQLAEERAQREHDSAEFTTIINYRDELLEREKVAHQKEKNEHVDTLHLLVETRQDLYEQQAALEDEKAEHAKTREELEYSKRDSNHEDCRNVEVQLSRQVEVERAVHQKTREELRVAESAADVEAEEADEERAARKKAEEDREGFSRIVSEMGAEIEWVHEACSGGEPSDFGLSFSGVREVRALWVRTEAAEKARDEAKENIADAIQILSGAMPMTLRTLPDLAREVAGRVKGLGAEVDRWSNYAADKDACLDRAEMAEAQVKKLWEGLRKIIDNYDDCDILREAEALLAEGEK